MTFLREETQRRGFPTPDGVHMGPCELYRRHSHTIGPDGSLYACPGFTGEFALAVGHIDGRRDPERVAGDVGAERALSDALLVDEDDAGARVGVESVVDVRVALVGIPVAEPEHGVGAGGGDGELGGVRLVIRGDILVADGHAVLHLEADHLRWNPHVDELLLEIVERQALFLDRLAQFLVVQVLLLLEGLNEGLAGLVQIETTRGPVEQDLLVDHAAQQEGARLGELFVELRSREALVELRGHLLLALFHVGFGDDVVVDLRDDFLDDLRADGSEGQGAQHDYQRCGSPHSASGHVRFLRHGSAVASLA